MNRSGTYTETLTPSEITRFPTARKLCAWAGLTPTVRNSDRKVRHGHITKAGPPWVRWILNEAAQWAKRDPAFAASYAAIAHRRGKHIATTAITRKLLAHVFHRLTEHAAKTKTTVTTDPDDTDDQIEE
jgi:transposase